MKKHPQAEPRARSRSHLPGNTERLVTTESCYHRNEADDAITGITSRDDNQKADEHSNRERSDGSIAIISVWWSHVASRGADCVHAGASG
jgi:hypothetical protein